MRSVLRQRPHEHPYAHPPFPGAQGFWLVQRAPAPPLGYVIMRSNVGPWVFDAYEHCRDNGGHRPWLRTLDTLSLAVARFGAPPLVEDRGHFHFGEGVLYSVPQMTYCDQLDRGSREGSYDWAGGSTETSPG